MSLDGKAAYARSLLVLTGKRIANNWRLVLALFVGLLLAAAIAAAVPIYAAGSLQDSFLAQWAREGTFRAPFTLILSHNNQYRKLPVSGEQLQALRRDLKSVVPSRVGLEPTSFTHYGRLGSRAFTDPSVTSPDLTHPRADVAQMANLQEVAEIVQGRWYRTGSDGAGGAGGGGGVSRGAGETNSGGAAGASADGAGGAVAAAGESGGVPAPAGTSADAADAAGAAGAGAVAGRAIEAVVDEATLEDMELIVGNTYRYFYPVPGRGEVGIPIRVVGFFRAKAGTTTVNWIYPPPFHRVVFVDPGIFEEFFLGELGIRARQYDMQWVFDYRDVRAYQLPGLIRDLESIERRAAAAVPETGFWLSPLEFFRDFNRRMENIRNFIFSLSVPTIAMVLYYITLMASLSFRRRETEIVVLLSRGAGRGQVVVSFLLEWLLVGGAAFAVSPLVGAVAARAIGASTGFLSFVDRQAVSISLMPQAWWFALAAAATGLLAGMAPTFSTFKYSIVTFKQQRGRRRGSRPLWSRIYLDVILLAIAAFGYRDLTLQSRAIDADAILSNDPVFFLVPFVGIFGAGLFCLRLFPTIIGLLHWVSIRFRGVVLQMTFRELYRNARHYAPLILLIILTVASGMYSASAARTLGENFEDQIYYRVGADLVVNEMWGQPEGAAPVSSSQLASSRAEPPFYRRLELPGVSSAARVFRARVGVHTDATRIGQADLMAVVPREFAQTAWYRQDLAPSHFYNYLKLLRRHPEGVLVSEAAAANSQLELGDVLTVSYSGQQLDVYVVGTVPYWPSLFPGEGRFLVANLAHIQNYALLEPYEVWYDLAPDAEVQLLIDEAVALGVYATDYTYARGEVRDLRREPYRMGFFGILSMGFIVSGLVTTLGIFAYSLFSMHNRRVQFGSLRALGLSARQLVSVLGLEHLTSFATGLVAGVAVGLGAVRLFLPFLRDRAEELQAVPPFLIVTESADLNRILIVLAVVFVVTVGGLAAILRRIRLGEAIRLGEEL